MNKDELEHIVENFLKSAKENLQKDKCLMPVALVITDDGPGVLMGLDIQEKQVMYAVLSVMIKRSKAQAYVIVAEAWVTTSSRTARSEAISIIGMDRMGNKVYRLVPFTRDGARIVFGEANTAVPTGGAMVSLF